LRLNPPADTLNVLPLRARKLLMTQHKMQNYRSLSGYKPKEALEARLAFSEDPAGKECALSVSRSHTLALLHAARNIEYHSSRTMMSARLEELNRDANKARFKAA
jgi:hypothetical protein